MGAVPGLRRRVQLPDCGEGGGLRGGRRHSPSCQRQSLHRCPQVYERRSRLARGYFRAHAHDRGALEKGAGRQGCRQAGVQPRCAQIAQSVFRISESPRPGRALQAPSTSAGFQRKFVVFLFFFLVLSFFTIGTKKNQSRTSSPKEEELARHWRISIRGF